MTDKAYIVANKEQEIELLKKFERKGFLWHVGRDATDFVPSENGFFNKFSLFTYVIIEKGFIVWSPIEQLEDEEIVYDGRKEGKMYKVTQEFMNELIKWRDNSNLDAQTSRPYAFVDGLSISEFPEVVEDWWVDLDDPIDNNNRLIAIIQWLNGEDIFEVEEPHKFVVRSNHTDKSGDYVYVTLFEGLVLPTEYEFAYMFDTREEAQEWANSHQVVVEIDAEGNEVE